MDFSDALASTASARAQMAFQERMSNTAHQREVADLKAAGLNPVLSAGGNGASTPNGAEGDFSSVLGILGTSVETSAKAVSRLGKSLEEAIKAGIPSSDAISNLSNLKDSLSGFGSYDNALNDLGNFLFQNFDDNERIDVPVIGRIKVADLKRKLSWFVADSGLSRVVDKIGLSNLARSAASATGLGFLFGNKSSAKANLNKRIKK